jgi:MarR family transcriptional regulator, 2-MHQ and catechol-resistance regulon repressor
MKPKLSKRQLQKDARPSPQPESGGPSEGRGSSSAVIPPPEPGPAEAAFRAFARATALFRNIMDPYFARIGISGAQWGVLRTLYRAEGEGLEGLRLSELGQRLWVKPPSVTGLIDRLERLDLVTRQVAAGDLRAKIVRLTPGGRELLMRVLEKHPAQINAVMAGLTGEQHRTLKTLMDQMAAHLEEMGKPGGGNGAKKPLPKKEEPSPQPSPSEGRGGRGNGTKR